MICSDGKSLRWQHCFQKEVSDTACTSRRVCSHLAVVDPQGMCHVTARAIDSRESPRFSVMLRMLRAVMCSAGK